jgi:tetratricopeptide (TPR) repeat protein
MSNESSASTEPRARLVRLQGFLAQDPDNLNLLAEAADEALGLGESETAQSAIQHALDLQPDDPFFRLRLSSVAIAERAFDDALAITSGLIADGKTDPAIRYNHAFALASAGRFAEAREMLDILRAEQVQYPGVVPLLIRSCHYLGDLDGAIAIALEHMESAPQDQQVAGMLSLLYFDKNDFAQAGEWSKRALADNEPSLDALLAAGGVALAGEDVDSARELTQRAISVQPRNGRAWANLGLAELLAVNLAGAREALARAVQYMPDHIGTWIALGWTQLLQNDIDGAEASFQSALAIDENFGEIHGGLAAVAAMRGTWEQAENSAKTARRLDPNSMAHHYPQILKMSRDGNGQAAERLIHQALKHQAAPGGGNLLDMLARVMRNRRP